MRSSLMLALAATASAARPFIDVADTGLEDWLVGSTNWTEGTLPNLQDLADYTAGALDDLENALPTNATGSAAHGGVCARA